MNSGLLIILLVLFTSSFSTETCEYSTDGTPPLAGMCAGPIDRTLAARRSVRSLNHGCPVNKVYYSKDRNSDDIRCGECVPGSSSTWYSTDIPHKYRHPSSTYECISPEAKSHRSCYEVETNYKTHPNFAAYQFCEWDEYCNDDGQCAQMETNPLEGAKCSFSSSSDLDGGSPDGCGPALRCKNKECSPCGNEEIRPVIRNRRGIVACKDGEIIMSKWELFLEDPKSILFMILTALIVLQSVIRLLKR